MYVREKIPSWKTKGEAGRKALCSAPFRPLSPVTRPGAAQREGTRPRPVVVRPAIPHARSAPSPMPMSSSWVLFSSKSKKFS